jgi:hypothetical protein
MEGVGGVVVIGEYCQEVGTNRRRILTEKIKQNHKTAGWLLGMKLNFV